LKIINLTPHTIRLADSDGNVLREIEPSGDVARVTHRVPERVSQMTVDVHSVPVVAHRPLHHGILEGLPRRQDACMYLVSLVCLDAAASMQRDDVYAPDIGSTGGVIRRDGQIFAVRRLISAYTVVYR
jgi:hypothetical protein